jgi:hypothetical protein
VGSTFDLPSPVWSEDERFWLCQVGRTEVSFRGGPDGVDPVSVELARRVLPELRGLEDEGRGFLHEFVDPARFQDSRDYYKIDQVGNWVLLCVDFGRRADLRTTEFELLFTLHEDVNGLWGVRFTHDAGNGVSFPVEFRRKQW